MAHLWLRSKTKIFFDARLRFLSEEIFNDVNADRKEVNQCRTIHWSLTLQIIQLNRRRPTMKSQPETNKVSNG